MTFLAHIADRALNRPLLLTPDKAAVLVGVLAGRIGIGPLDGGVEASRFEGEAPLRRDAAGRPVEFEPFRVSDGVAIITITGSLVNRGAWIGASSGLTSYEGIQHQLKRAAANADVHSVVLDIHSPGGEAVGAFETAAMVREVAKSKRVVAVVNGMAASAAYAIASGADDIVVTESGIAGSIGVVWLHADYSRYLENEGIKPTFIFAGKHKVDGHPFGPLPDEVRADIQAEIDAVYAQFLKTVAAGRGDRMSVDMARATEAQVFAGAAAVEIGLADAVGTFESVLADLTRGSGRTTSQKGTTMRENEGGPAADANAGTFTQAQLDAAVAEARTAAENGLQARIDTAVNEAIAADRGRIAGLDGLLAQLGNHPKAAEIVTAAKAEGASVNDTKVKLFDAGVMQQAGALKGLADDDASAAGARPAAPGNGPQAAQGEDGWKAEFEVSDALKAEYGTAGAYVAFKRAEQQGRIRISQGAKAA